jgi:hypothetical protein
MYRFSRSIYRELAPLVIEDTADPADCANKVRVLDACEGTIRRMTCDGRYFARPARSLFSEVRCHFAMNDQLRVWRVIETNIELALEFLAKLPEGAILDGVPRQCHAHTRKGTPCQREPLPGRDYCPSHKHLEDTFEATELELDEAFAEAEREYARRDLVAV